MSLQMLATPPVDSELRPVPGEPGPPLVGQTLRMLRHPHAANRERYETYGPVSWANLFGKPTVVMLGPDACGAVLANRDRAFSSGLGWGRFLDNFFYRGIMLLDFEEHLHHRRIMQQAFTTERLASYLSHMSPAVRAGVGRWPDRGDLKFYPAVKRLTLDLAAGIFMGEEKLGARAEEINRAFIGCVQAGTSLIRFPVPGGRWRKGIVGRRVLEQFLREYLPKKRSVDGADLFTALCHAESEDGHRFTDDDVINHMIFLLMAAHDTTTITLTTMVWKLGQHPEWQERCRQECLALDNDQLAYADLDKLASLDLVMKESLRLVAPVPSVPRQAVKDTEVLGHFIPAGTDVTMGLHFTQHMPEYWPDPERFDPDRFAEHRREDKVHRYAWLPFGGGVHKCIGLYFAGMQVKAVMNELLRRYRWQVDPAYEAPLNYVALPYPTDGLPIALEPVNQ
ncbi:cytochrome P450 [Fodinicola acaciae]|uniref:cytochrome P450 n=1 Tax=Fodinicola acaciae TaxID=2681555 RepID=UPI0013D3D06E|nr:cytochrome P450 [Fodinicola acaciae]